MTYLKRAIALVFIGLAFACNFTEEIYFNNDGSGKLNIGFDGDELMAMMGSMEDSLKQEEAVDTTMVFRDLLREKKDSIAQLPLAEQEKLKKLEPFSLHMLMDPEKKTMKFDMFSDFKEISEVNDAFSAFQEATTMSPKMGVGETTPPQPSTGNQATRVNYTFERNRFSRNIEIVDQELFQQSMDSIQSAEMFLSGSTYTFKYHFPSRVKSTNVEGATFSMDGKTIIYEVNFMDMMKNPEAFDIEVELEK